MKNPFSQMNSFVRGMLVVALIALVVVVLQLQLTLTALFLIASIIFPLAIAYFVYLLWRERRGDFAVWPARSRFAFYGGRRPHRRRAARLLLRGSKRPRCACVPARACLLRFRDVPRLARPEHVRLLRRSRKPLGQPIPDDMGWRRRPRTLNEELLAEAPRDRDLEAVAEEELQQGPAWRVRLALGIAAALVFLSLHRTVAFLPPWIQIVAGTLVVAHFVSIFLRSTRHRSVGAAKGLRIIFLVCLAVCVWVTVMAAIGGFQDDDWALLSFVWPILALIWMAYRLRAASVTRRAEAGS